MTIDDELNQAADDLRRELRTANPPPLDRSRAGNRSDAGSRLVLVVASLAVFVIGGLFVANRSSTGGDPTVNQAATDADGEEQIESEVSEGDDPTGDDPTGDDSTGGDSTGDDPAGVDADSVALALPGGSPAWNAGGSLLLVYEVGIDGGGHALYNGESLERMRRLDLTPADIEEVYWDPATPEQVYYVSNGELIAQDVFTDGRTVVHRFDGCEAVQSSGVSQPISRDGQRFGFICERDGTAELVALDLSTGQEVRRPAPDLGTVGPVPLPNGSGYVARSGAGLVEVFDTELEPTGVTFTVGTDQFVVVGTADDRQLFVTSVYGQPEDAVGSVVGFDLATGEAIVAIGESAGDPYPPSGTQLAASVSGAAQVVITIVGDPTAVTPTSLDGTVFVVDFDPVEPTVTSVTSGVAWLDNPAIDPYWSHPYPAIDPVGNRVLFPQSTGGQAVRPAIVQLDGEGTP